MIAPAVQHVLEEIAALRPTARIIRRKERLLAEPRVVSLEEALLVTDSYRQHEDLPRILRRAEALRHTFRHVPIRIDPDELIVGNRTPTSRAGVVFPEASVAWIDREIETLPTRPQDRFEVTPEQVRQFREQILPYWRGRTLEDRVYASLDEEVFAARRIVKINQRDHAQGHIIPNVRNWLRLGPAGLQAASRERLAGAEGPAADFYRAVDIALAGCREFIGRYAVLADDLAGRGGEAAGNLRAVADACRRLQSAPPRTFREAVQAVWFLFVALQMESNASSFSPGRLDQYLLPYFEADVAAGRLDLGEALELLEALWLKFNAIVYMRNADSARYFAGFPIGFNVCIGGQTPGRHDATNALSYLCLKAQEHLLLPQPNLSLRLHEGSAQELLERAARVIGKGSGMPQVFNDESVIPALIGQGIDEPDALDYAVVGCVELSPQGNSLGWSDAAMFNMVKVLELALNDGVDMLTGARLGPATGTLADHTSFAELERAYERQMDHFISLTIRGCRTVERAHAEVLPSPLLSSVIDDCLAGGVDVTAGGAKYNLSGIQGIQVANVADSFAALKRLVFEERSVAADDLLAALRCDFEGREGLRQRLIHGVPKYGNDVEWVDRLGARWAEAFARKLARFRNPRGGPVHAGFYTVSAHVPMGNNVAATPDGRRAGAPLADGGLSPMYGRDARGPTAVLKSVSRIDGRWGSNGTLLNMKFLPRFFREAEDVRKFVALLRGLVRLRIHHAQFNVVNPEDLRRAKEDPESYRHLTVRVAGYTAYFTELADDLQDEIIARTWFGG